MVPELFSIQPKDKECHYGKAITFQCSPADAAETRYILKNRHPIPNSGATYDGEIS